MNRAAVSRPVADGSAVRGLRRPPQKATSVILTSGLAIDAALRQLMGVSFAHFRANLAGVLQSVEPEYVHQLRVAVRRMRCAAQLFPRDATCGRPRRLNASLKRLSALLGAVRDPEVLLERVNAMPNILEPAEAAELRASLAARVFAAREALRLYLESAAYERFATRIALWVAARPHGNSDDGVLVDVARRRLASWHGRIRRAVKHFDGLNDTDLHRLRVRIKRSRYAAEFFRGLFNEKAVRSYVAVLGIAQDRLGSLTDIKTGQALLRELGLGEEVGRILHVASVECARVTDEELVALLKACCQAGGYWKRKKRGSDHV